MLIPLFAAVLFGAQLSPAVACSCVPQSKAQLAENATVIFMGTATGVSQSQPFSFTRGCYRSSADPVTVAFDVETVYKGDVARRTGVETAMSGASCGAEFTIGKRYTVFATVSGGRVETNLCRGNVEGEIVAAEYGLGTPHPPK